MKCVCTGPGFCELHAREMSAGRWRQCHDKPGYFEIFAAAAGKHAPARTLDCQHRGEQTREATADLCGYRKKQFPVFACAIHGECSLSRFCRKQTVKSCAVCEDRSPATQETV